MFFIKSILNQINRCSRKSSTPLQRIINKKKYLVQPFSLQSHADPGDNTLEDIVEEICKGDPELTKKLRILMLEVEVMREDGRRAPDMVKKDQWEHLLSLSSLNQRRNYLLYLFKNEKSKENEKIKKEARRIKMVKPEDTKEYPDDLLYGLEYQSLFLRIRDKSINNFDNYRALQAIMYGQPLVIDCSYDEHMVSREILNAAKQMTFVFGDNRIHREPFNIHLCNVDVEGQFTKQLRKNIPSLDKPWFPLNIHRESYLDLFPKDKLVYLTPHCKEELTEFDHDAIYIIGCMVDKIDNAPHSLAKAKRDGIKMAKFPLDRHLEWGSGSKKNLNINHVVSIMLDLRFTGDWEYSLRHVPRRKLMETKILAMQNKIKNKQLVEDIFKDLRRPSKFGKDRKDIRRTLYADDDNI